MRNDHTTAPPKPEGSQGPNREQPNYRPPRDRAQPTAAVAPAEPGELIEDAEPVGEVDLAGEAEALVDGEAIILVCDHYGSRSVQGAAQRGHLIQQHHERISTSVASSLAESEISVTTEDLWPERPTFVEGDRVGFVFRSNDRIANGVVEIAQAVIEDREIEHTAVALAKGSGKVFTLAPQGLDPVPYLIGPVVALLDAAADHCPEGRIFATFPAKNLRQTIEINSRKYWTATGIKPGDIFDEVEVRAKLLELYAELLAAKQVDPLLRSAKSALDLRATDITVRDLCLLRDAFASLLQTREDRRKAGGIIDTLRRSRVVWKDTCIELLERIDEEIIAVRTAHNRLPDCIKGSEAITPTAALVELFTVYSDDDELRNIVPADDLASSATIDLFVLHRLTNALEETYRDFSKALDNARERVAATFSLHRSDLVPPRGADDSER